VARRPPSADFNRRPRHTEDTGASATKAHTIDTVLLKSSPGVLKMEQKDRIVKSKEVILRLDEATALDLEQLLYSLGELVAAGAPIHPPPADVEKRLGVVYFEILRQLGKPTMAEAMQASIDNAYARVFEPPEGGWPTIDASALVLPKWLCGAACSTVVPLRQQPGVPFFVTDDDVNMGLTRLCGQDTARPPVDATTTAALQS